MAFDEIAGAAIQGVTEAVPWQSFVRLLRDHFGGNHANIIFRHPSIKQNFMTEDFADEILQIGNPRDRYQAEDDPIPYYRMEPFKSYEIADFLTAGVDHPFMTRFLLPLGMPSLLICRVTTSTGLQAWISVTHAQSTFFQEAERAELSRIGVLFSQALVLFGAYKEATDQRDAYACVLRARATGLIRIDQDGKVVNLDPDTATWIDERHCIRLVNGRLRAITAADRRKLDLALEGILTGQSDEELLALGSDGPQAVELLIFPVSETFDPAWTSATRAIIYVRVAGREIPPTPQRIRKLFGLSRREAALAILLTQGLTLAQASEHLGVSNQTARTYLRQIFQKTGVTRQAELIRQIQASIASVQRH